MTDAAGRVTETGRGIRFTATTRAARHLPWPAESITATTSVVELVETRWAGLNTWVCTLDRLD